MTRRRGYTASSDDARLVQRPEGYRWIMVNGEVTFENSQEAGVYPGP